MATDNIQGAVVLIDHPAEHVTRVTLNRPEARNAVNGAVAAALGSALGAVEADPGAWVGILRGAGEVFCAGADLKAIAAGQGDSLYSRERGFAGFTHAPRTKPWIAATQGSVLAGGLELALACDFIVASETCQFGVPEVLRGLIAGAGGVYRLPRAIPRAVALEMVATGRPIDVARALQFGLVNRVVPASAVDGEALALAGSITQAGPMAVRESLKLARAAYDASDDELWRRSFEANLALMDSEDYAEGPRAFVEKRPPQWTGR